MFVKGFGALVNQVVIEAPRVWSDGVRIPPRQGAEFHVHPAGMR